jgi:hypothetical protein
LKQEPGNWRAAAAAQPKIAQRPNTHGGDSMSTIAW